MTAARSSALLRVTAPEPTEVPMALATLLAPMPQHTQRPKAKAMTWNTVECCAMISTMRPLAVKC